ncbi:MAG TPA: glycosyltransferase [Acidiphilium sp.]|nr:MAG: hypothetical protein B7Z67_11180 [Acidiphilium sp. 21-60-14]OYV89410.1 MAG: hypothetical protein B7Z57_12815 [Acidiphilium sp. 37-60-79]OZB39755.1 MAG: hypothetical protein B7X48_07995 [Acidiphilium sp. 34-60-192]HQT89586.1 glycosyltransferase [Acidiphilium sp.]HQU24955.1 glycosyltransferase [Acidiphilium sp.]
MPVEPLLCGGQAPPLRAYDADIVIISHFRPDETVAAIRSAQAQAGGDFWVIVLDQASDPAMRAQIMAALAGLDRVAFYTIEANLGVPGGRNLACGLGRGRVIVALDNDAVFANEAVVATAVARLRDAPALGVIGFRILARDGVALDATSWGYPRSLQARAAERFSATTFVGCGFAMARRCFDALGGFDATLFFTWEEYEFSRRAIEAGWLIAYHGDLSVCHAVAAEARVAWRGDRWGYFVRNRLVIAHDWHGWLGMGPFLLLYGWRGLRMRQARATLRAMAAGMVMARTRRVRRASTASRRYIWAHETRARLVG